MADEKNNDINYVTINLSKNQIDFEHIHTSGRNGKEYVRIIGPEKGNFFYPKESLKQEKDNPDRYYFVRPADAEITLRFSERREGVPDDAPKEEKYRTGEKVVTVAELKQMYDSAKQAYKEQKAEERENNPFVNITVPNEWLKEFESKKDGTHYVSVRFPVKEEDHVYNYELVIPAYRVKQSDYDEGMSYFGFPKNKKDSEEAYMIQLSRHVKDGDGAVAPEFVRISKDVTSLALSELISAAKPMEIEVSEKLIHSIEHDGKDLMSVSVPVMQEEKEVFYSVVLEADKVRQSQNEGKMIVSVTSFDEYTAKHGVKDESTGKYNNVVIKMTGEVIAQHFRESRERYLEEKHQEENDREMTEDHTKEQSEEINNHHKRGR